jgi:hypothetical protein
VRVKLKRYLRKLKKQQRRRGAVIYSEGNPANSLIRLGSPFSFGNCVLWRDGEEEAYKRKLEERC